MDNDFVKSENFDTESDLALMDQKIRKQEEEALKNVLKHFDRIHDKLFTFNNILIAGYFALSKLDRHISLSTILIPLVNLILLVFVEYKMMEKSRFESEITKKTYNEIKNWGNSINKTNLYSLLCISSTALVTIIFLAYLLH